MSKDIRIALLTLPAIRGHFSRIPAHLTTTDHRLFADLFTLEQATRLEEDPDLAERVEAFVGRFGRLQDTVGDKLLPLL